MGVAVVWLQREHQSRPWGRERRDRDGLFDHPITPGECRMVGLESAFTWETTRRSFTRSCMPFFVLWGFPSDDKRQERNTPSSLTPRQQSSGS